MVDFKACISVNFCIKVSEISWSDLSWCAPAAASEGWFGLLPRNTA